MKYAYLENNTAKDTSFVDPFTIFAKGHAEQFIECPDEVEPGWTLINGVWSAPAPTAPVVPSQVTMRQACLALEDAGLLDDVEALVDTLPRKYQIEWQRASVVNRDNALVEIVRQQKNMTSAQIDDLFIMAAGLV